MLNTYVNKHRDKSFLSNNFGKKFKKYILKWKVFILSHFSSILISILFPQITNYIFATFP